MQRINYFPLVICFVQILSSPAMLEKVAINVLDEAEFTTFDYVEMCIVAEYKPISSFGE